MTIDRRQYKIRGKYVRVKVVGKKYVPMARKLISLIEGQVEKKILNLALFGSTELWR